MANRILVGSDGSAPSRAALAWAIRRARAASDRIELTIEHVVDTAPQHSDLSRQASVDAERILADDIERCTTLGVEAITVIRHGQPSLALIRDSADTDLLVVGSPQTGFLRGRVLGTRSVVIAAAAFCSVVVVPENNIALRRGVVVGVGPGTTSDTAVIAGAREAAHLNDELSLIHSAPGDEVANEAQFVLHRATELASSVAPGLVVRRRISRRRASEVLLDAGRAAALVVLGSPANESRTPGYIGTVVHEVLLNLNSPVMIAR